VRRDVKGVNLDACFVNQGKILFARAYGGRGQKRHSCDSEAACRYGFDH
jgi:hypothetical protein